MTKPLKSTNKQKEEALGIEQVQLAVEKDPYPLKNKEKVAPKKS
jgi:hypothetical protein